MAESTERRLTRDLMFEAVPNSSASIFAAREIWSFGGRIREIMLVPLLRTTHMGGGGVSMSHDRPGGCGGGPPHGARRPQVAAARVPCRGAAG